MKGWVTGRTYEQGASTNMQWTGKARATDTRKLEKHNMKHTSATTCPNNDAEKQPCPWKAGCAQAHEFADGSTYACLRADGVAMRMCIWVFVSLCVWCVCLVWFCLAARTWFTLRLPRRSVSRAWEQRLDSRDRLGMLAAGAE